MKNKAKALVLSAALLSSTANAIDLSGTIFDKAAKAYNLDPLLVYSVAFVDLQAKLIHCLHRILIRFTQPLWA
ncbi:hypothetical protein ACV8SB_25220 [Citrobacter freundii]